MTPGMDLLSKATNYAVKGGKYAKQALVVAEYATIASRTMAALMSAEDFGKAVAGMIDKYLVYEAEITWEIAYDFLVLAATGVQLGFYTGSALKIPDELAKHDFDEIMKQNIRARYETTSVDGYISGVTVNYSTLSNVGKGGNGSNGVVNGKTPASRLADKLRHFSNSNRPNTVAVIRTAGGKYYIGYNKAGIYNEQTQTVLNELGNVNIFNRQCAEVNAVSRALNGDADLNESTISVVYVRGVNNNSGVHGTYKKPCNVCQPLLDYFGIKDIY